jgi:hypothetical protein
MAKRAQKTIGACACTGEQNEFSDHHRPSADGAGEQNQHNYFARERALVKGEGNGPEGQHGKQQSIHIQFSSVPDS